MGAKERDRLFHYAAGVGNEPLRSPVNLGTIDDELKGLYTLAEQRARLTEIANEQQVFLEKFTAFMGDGERAQMADLSRRLGELNED